MGVEIRPAQALRLLHDVALDLVGDEAERAAPISACARSRSCSRIYLEAPPHTVRGLAAKLRVTKPVVTRALDSLGKQRVLTRRRDALDRRSVVVQRTVEGRAVCRKARRPRPARRRRGSHDRL